MLFAFLNHTVGVTVHLPSRSVLVPLNLDDNLTKVREILKENTQIEMNDKLLFAKKNNNTESLTVIAKESEVIFPLKEITNDDNSKSYNLYLIKNPKLSWTILNDNCKLDYGRTMSIDGNKIADKRAFIM